MLTINGSSSSIKFALYGIYESLMQLLYGEMESICTKSTKLIYTNTITNQKNSVDIKAVDHAVATYFLIDWLEKQDWFVSVKLLIILIAMLNNITMAQDKSTVVTGKVISFEESFPIEGASLAIKGTKNNIGTQVDGSFALAIQRTDSIIVVSYEGFVTQEFKIQAITQAQQLTVLLWYNSMITIT